MEKEESAFTWQDLAPIGEFIPALEAFWSRGVVTNTGPYHRQLGAKLCENLGVDHVSLFASGTLALFTALHALRINGEVITTPFSFPATSHSLLWNNITPIFADIDPLTCNLDVGKIEEAITPQTTAILPVHCYGCPCDVEGMQELADTYGLMLIYDAAHAFDVRYRGESLLKHGDLSVLSFHATKVFNTFEGGAIISPDERTKQRIDYLKNFGFANETTVTAPGINGKMSEVNAAFGLLQLKYIDDVIDQRRRSCDLYRTGLANVPGITLLAEQDETVSNAAYFPIFVEPDFAITRDELYFMLRERGIHGRRYFYPLISTMPMYRSLPSAAPGNLPNAVRTAEKVICLPLFAKMRDEDVWEVIRCIVEAA